MSNDKTIQGIPLHVTPPDAYGACRVRRADGAMRILGTVARSNLGDAAAVHMGWEWAAHPMAFLAEGGTQRGSDVPKDLLERGTASSQDRALEALVAWLRQHDAPVIGSGGRCSITTAREAAS